MTQATSTTQATSVIPQTTWLASYPKSGNTWTRAIFTALRSDTDLNVNALVGGVVPASRELLDDVLGVPSSDLTIAELDNLRPLVDEAVAASTEEIQLRKVHDAFVTGSSGQPVVSVRAARGVLYVVRDPRDVVVSYAHHAGRPVEWAVELLCRAGATTADPPDGVAYQSRQRIGSWSEHVTSWLDQDLLPVQLIRYEDALTDPIGVFTAAMRFIGLDVTEEEIAVAVSRSSFERLAAQEAEHGFAERVRPDSRFFRRGRSGGWREELPADLADLVVGTHRETMTRLGYLDR